MDSSLTLKATTMKKNPDKFGNVMEEVYGLEFRRYNQKSTKITLYSSNYTCIQKVLLSVHHHTNLPSRSTLNPRELFPL